MEHHEHHHEHGHHHHHHHLHDTQVSTLNRAFIVGIVLNVLFVVVEATFGFIFDSVGLLSDAGHNLTDVVSLLLAMLAFRLTAVHGNSRFTYGYKKSTILISLLNAVLLLVAVCLIVVESIQKIITPQEVQGLAVAIVAGVGIVINAFTAWLFIKDKDKDLNVKGAYLHMAADALVSIGVLIAGLIIHFTGFYLIDPIIGLGIAAIIVISTWNLLKESITLALDGVPKNIDYDDVSSIFEAHDNVADFHHLHIWGISTTENALTVHVVLQDLAKMEQTKTELKKNLAQHGIQHATIEIEQMGVKCENDCSHK